MSLYKRNDSPHWWVKISHSGRTIQRSTGTEDKARAQEYHDKLKASLWEQQRLGIKPRRSWKEAVVRWLAETSEKATHDQDIAKLRWLDSLLGGLLLDEITLDVIDRIKAERLKTVNKATVNRYLALVRAILLRARDEWEWIDKAPKVKLFKEGPGRERSITVEQAETLLGELRVHQRDVVLFALATGLRHANVVGLEWSHVDLDAGHAWVERLNRRIAGRSPCRSTQPRWRSCDGSSGSILSGCLRMPGSRSRGRARKLGRRPWCAPGLRTSAGTI